MADEIVLLSHGGGGLRTKRLISGLIMKYLANPILAKLDDGACLSLNGEELAFTTDSYVVKPIFFPGGDIGRLSVCGTVNDLVMQGSEPRFLSLAFILEEGFPISDLEKILISIADTVSETGVTIATGDTKVVEKGRGDGIFINTAGIGVRIPHTDVYVGNAKPGDVVIVTGTIGDHGTAVMNDRLRLEADISSDVAPLWKMIEPVLKEVPDIHCLRDPTRGGLASALCDIAEASGACVRINENALPIRDEVRGVCDLLGLDPLNVANEGKAVIVCEQSDAERVLEILKTDPIGRDARIIGSVVPNPQGIVLLCTPLGGERIVETPMGEDLPRIC